MTNVTNYFVPMYKYLQDFLQYDKNILLEEEIGVTSNYKKYDENERRPKKHTQQWQTSMHMAQQ